MNAAPDSLDGSSELLLDLAPGLLLGAGLTLLLAALARRSGLGDDGSDAPLRKPQRVPVPLVGGIAIFLAVVFTVTQRETWGGGAWSRGLDIPVTPWGAFAMIGALVAGSLDDVATKGLRPAVKFAAQIAIALCCARHALEATASATALVAFSTFAIALLAMNAFNTFDNADGAATSLGALGLFAVAPLLAAPLLGFLPCNLWVRRKAPDGSTTPLAYLGDAGSHFLGVLVALVPGAWPVLALPLLDLARLSLVRWKRGSRPWIGDRRHLAHRLQARGFGPTLVVLLLLFVAAPSVLAASLSGGAPIAVGAGLLATALLFVLAVRATPDLP